jgi:hypothetical protein
MSRPIIIGAGLSGLLAANMLSRRLPIVIEKSPDTPNSHKALLRFRSSIVSEVVGIPFKKVRVIKCSVPMPTDAAAALAYSYKCTGTFRSDRSLPNGTETGDRFIAPEDLVTQLAAMAEVAGVEFRFNQECDLAEINDLLVEHNGPILSTIPMPELMDVLDYQGPRPEFRSHSVGVYRAKVDCCDAYATVYDPRPNIPFARASITGNELIVERPYTDSCSIPSEKEDIIMMAAELLGLEPMCVRKGSIEFSIQRYAKILPCDDDKRKQFINWATDVWHIYSLGRFATWRPGLLLDDLVKDIRLIEKWSASKTKYDVKAYR